MNNAISIILLIGAALGVVSCVVGGRELDTDTDTDTDTYGDTDTGSGSPADGPFVTGCGEGDETFCANLTELEWGDCGIPQGYGFVDGKCALVSGCEGDNPIYCLYPTVEDCVYGCGAASVLGLETVGFLPCDGSVIEGNLNPNWPLDWGDTDPTYATCDIIYVCYEEHESYDPEVVLLTGLFSDEMDILLDTNPYALCPVGTQNWNLAEAVELTEDVWSHLCSYSLLEETKEMRCYR